MASRWEAILRGRPLCPTFSLLSPQPVRQFYTMRSFAGLLLVAACLSVGSAVSDLLDPTSLVDELSQRSAGLQRWKKPEFCG